MDEDSAQQSQSALSRVAILSYGVFSYFIGVAGLLAIIAMAAGILAPGFLLDEPLGASIAINLALVTIWGAIHTWMARASFKRMLVKILPEPAERSTYVLVAGVTSCLLVGLWQVVPGSLWKAENPILIGALWGMFALGWAYLLAATFAINHFDLFGLRQVYLNFRNQARPPLAFIRRAMYRFSRHPIQTGVLIGIWFVPEMTYTHLMLSICFTVYIFIGLWFEEKDLIADIGEPYKLYRREAGMFLPKIW